MHAANTFIIAALARYLTLSAFVLPLAACAGLSEACRENQKAMISDLLYFGTAKPDGVVSAHEWQRFIDNEVSRRFPQGLTAWQASGQWRVEGGPIIRESSYILNLVHPDNADTEAAINEIMSHYKSRFRQNAVLRVRGSVCVSF